MKHLKEEGVLVMPNASVSSSGYGYYFEIVHNKSLGQTLVSCGRKMTDTDTSYVPVLAVIVVLKLFFWICFCIRRSESLHHAKTTDISHGFGAPLSRRGTRNTSREFSAPRPVAEVHTNQGLSTEMGNPGYIESPPSYTMATDQGHGFHGQPYTPTTAASRELPSDGQAVPIPEIVCQSDQKELLKE